MAEGPGSSDARRNFPDHFSAVAAAYAEFRPRYPEAVFDLLADLAPARRLAWDCATGNGQAAGPLAARFERVVATDASGEQLAQAAPRANIEYRVARAEASGLPDACADLVTVAQALHWFDVEAFHAEAERVLVPGGVLAEWSYGTPSAEPPVDAPLGVFYAQTVGPYWPPTRVLVDAGYRDIPFPFARLPVPDLALQADLSLRELLGYVDTWSAVQRFRAANGSDPLPAFANELAAVWGPPERRRHIRWPLTLRVGRRPA